MDRQSVLTVRNQPGYKGVTLSQVATETSSKELSEKWTVLERILSFLFPVVLNQRLLPEEWRESQNYLYRVSGRQGIEPRKELRGYFFARKYSARYQEWEAFLADYKSIYEEYNR